jgi:hypothetical protein
VGNIANLGRFMLKPQELAQPEKMQKPCQHFWIIEPANGVTSLGKCKYCGIVKEFVNNLTQYSRIKKDVSTLVSGENDLG